MDVQNKAMKKLNAMVAHRKAQITHLKTGVTDLLNSFGDEEYDDEEGQKVDGFTKDARAKTLTRKKNATTIEEKADELKKETERYSHQQRAAMLN